MNVAHLLARAGRIAAGRPALLSGNRILSDYAALAGDSAAMAGTLVGCHGLAAGDSVALVMKNVPDYVECLFACWHAGWPSSPATWRRRWRRRSAIWPGRHRPWWRSAAPTTGG